MNDTPEQPASDVDAPAVSQNEDPRTKVKAAKASLKEAKLAVKIAKKAAALAKREVKALKKSLPKRQAKPKKAK